MFRKIISNLPFSSSLVEQLGIYAKIVKKEENIRRLGLLFIFLAIAVQVMILAQPPESANAGDKIVNLDNSSSNLTADGLELSVSATNVTQGFIDATKTIAEPQEQIIFTITIYNPSQKQKSVEITNNMVDILEYAELVDDGGGKLDKTSNLLAWPQINIEPESKQTRTYTVRILKDMPATAQGTNNSRSFDCQLTNVFGNTLNISVRCPAPKLAEQIIMNLPKIDQPTGAIITIFAMIVSLYFYARARQIKEEVRLIRKDINSGVI